VNPFRFRLDPDPTVSGGPELDPTKEIKKNNHFVEGNMLGDFSMNVFRKSVPPLFLITVFFIVKISFEAPRYLRMSLPRRYQLHW
jgi:hypothetical protein